MPRTALIAVVVGVLAALGLIGFSVAEGDAAPTTVYIPVEYAIERDPDVPSLPFDDNPDPAQCGIPVQWGENGTAYLTGIWDGELIQPEVLVYDSHLRVSITGRAPHGTRVQVVLFQENPTLDYYFVQIPAEWGGEEGWVPEHFLSFEPVA